MDMTLIPVEHWSTRACARFCLQRPELRHSDTESRKSRSAPTSGQTACIRRILLCGCSIGVRMQWCRSSMPAPNRRCPAPALMGLESFPRPREAGIRSRDPPYTTDRRQRAPSVPCVREGHARR